MRRPRYVVCVLDFDCPILDTRSGSVLEAEAARAATLEAIELDVGAKDVQAALGLGGECYMARAIAAARLDRRALSVLFPRLDCERPCASCPSAQGQNLAHYGGAIDPEVAALLVESRAGARAVEAAGNRRYRGQPEEQLRAARAAMAGARRRGQREGRRAAK